MRVTTYNRFVESADSLDIYLHLHIYTHTNTIYMLLLRIYGIYNTRPSAAALMTLLDECNWNAAILRTARDVLCSVG